MDADTFGVVAALVGPLDFFAFGRACKQYYEFFQQKYRQVLRALPSYWDISGGTPERVVFYSGSRVVVGRGIGGDYWYGYVIHNNLLSYFTLYKNGKISVRTDFPWIFLRYILSDIMERFDGVPVKLRDFLAGGA